MNENMNEELFVKEEVDTFNEEAKETDDDFGAAGGILIGAAIGIAAIGIFEGGKYAIKGCKKLYNKVKAKHEEAKSKKMANSSDEEPEKINKKDITVE